MEKEASVSVRIAVAKQMENIAPNFGLLIAYVLPGFVVLIELSYHSTTVARWFIAKESSGGFLFALLASLTLGVFVSGLRWAIVDQAFVWLGRARPDYDYGLLTVPDYQAAFQRANENFYRHYQFYANTAVALLLAYAAALFRLNAHTLAYAIGLLVVEVALILVAWDCITKTDKAIDDIVGFARRKGDDGKR